MTKLGDVFMPNILSPFNVSDIVENLVELRRKMLSQPISERKKVIEDRSDALSNLRKLGLDFLSTSQAISSVLSYRVFRAELKNLSGTEDPKNILGVSVGPDAVQGNFDVTVNQLAQSWKISSSVFSGADVTLGSLGVASGSRIIVKGSDSADARVIEVDPSWTIKQLRDRINEIGAGITAYIQNVSGGVQLVFSSSRTGASREYMTVVDASGNALQQLGFISSAPDIIKNQRDFHVVSDAFTKKDGSGNEIGKLMGFAPGSAPSGTVYIKGVAVTLDLNTMTLEDLKDTINSVVSSGTAEVIQEGGVYRLKINTTDFNDNGTTVLKTIGILAKDFQNVVSYGRNAQITVDGSIYLSSDNVFSPDETGIAGLTFTALRTSSDVIRVAISRDIDRIMKYFSDFVEAWNRVIDFLNEQIKFDEKSGRSGVLSGDFSVQATRSAMRRAFSGVIEVGGSDGLSRTVTIQDLGFSIDREGKLSLNQGKLRELLERDFELTVRAITSATSEKVVGGAFSSDTSPLGLTGEFIVDGKSVVVSPQDTLRDIALRINSASDSVRAYIRTVSGNKKLVIERISGGLPSLADVSGNILVSLGFGSPSDFLVKNQINSTTLRTSVFFSASSPVRNSLDRNIDTQDTANNIAGNIVIPIDGGGTVSIFVDISSDSLEDIAEKINSSTGSAIASVKQDGDTYYLEISGVRTDPSEWSGNINLLQFLGILKRKENKEAVKVGFAEHMRRELGALLSSKGAIGASRDRVDAELADINKKLTKLDEELESYRATLYERWSRVNQLIVRTRSVMYFFQAISQQLIKGIDSPFSKGG